MKEQLLNLARDKGFNSIFSVGIHVNELGWLFWLVELQKWLREVHNIHISIYPIKRYWMMDVRDCNLNNIIHICKCDSQLEFITYEEALENGILEALKLIK